MQLRPRPNERGTCVFCRDPLTEATTTCAGCQATYHRDCLDDELQGRCATIGCLRTQPESTTEPCPACSAAIGDDPRMICTGCATVYHLACWNIRLGAHCISRRCRPHISDGRVEGDGAIYAGLLSAGLLLVGILNREPTLIIVGLAVAMILGVKVYQHLTSD